MIDIFQLTNTINIEHYDLRSNFVIQSRIGSKQKSKFLEDWKFHKIIIFHDDGKNWIS
jgi:hypothetical protein